MSNDNVQLVQTAYEAFGRGDIPAVLEALTEDVDWNVPEVLPHGGHAQGREEVGQFFQRIADTWEDFDVDVRDIVASGDRVCVVGAVGGKLNGAQTGYGFVHAWTVSDGSLARLDEYVDPSPELLQR